MEGIPLYTEINQLHELTGASLRTRNPLFHCFDMADANDLPVSELPPHRASFYTLALNFGTEDLYYKLNDRAFAEPHNFVLCVAPGHVARWRKEGDWFGFCTFFKHEFLHEGGAVDFLRRYPFFNINETNLFPVTRDDFGGLKDTFQLIIREQERQGIFYEEVIRSLFQGILWTVRRLYEASAEQTTSPRAGATITAHFQHLVNECFLEKAAVADYAQALHVTPNHLSQTIKATTGRTAKSIITERRMNEAKYLLTYTDNLIADIAYHLGFTEPTHFTKFFKKSAGCSPLQYRERRTAVR